MSSSDPTRSANPEQGAGTGQMDTPRVPNSVFTYAQVIRGSSPTNGSALAHSPESDRLESVTKHPTSPHLTQSPTSDDQRSTDTSLENKLANDSDNVTRLNPLVSSEPATWWTSDFENETVPAAPLFLNEQQIAFDHEMSFSQYGKPFKRGLSSLQTDTTPKVYELMKRTFPVKAQKLKDEYFRHDMAERSQVLYSQRNTYAQAMSNSNTSQPKMSWNQLDIPDKSTLVDTDDNLANFMAVMQTIKPHDFELFLDCEGNSLGRDGTLCLLQVMVASLDHTWVLDISMLREKVFDTRGPGPTGRSLREILGDKNIPKMFYDVRNDADALYTYYGIRLQCVIDLQFMELAIRDSDRIYRKSLSDCMNEASRRTLVWYEAAQWQYNKSKGKDYCEGPEGWAIYHKRPLPRVLLRYAVNDVERMPELFTYLSERGLGMDAKGQQAIALVAKESQRMADESTLENYRPDGPKRNVAPTSFEEIRDKSSEV